MFRILGTAPELVELYVDGESVGVPAGISVAAALLYVDAQPTRHTAVSGSPRGPFCMMGICFECLIEIDGCPNQRACQLEVRPGMKVRRQGLVQNAGSMP